MIYTVFDFETKSKVDIKKSGVWEYSRHPSTEILCVAWAVGTKEELKKPTIKTWRRGESLAKLEDLKARLRDPKTHLVAHNALFENCITKNVLGIDVPLHRWTCTAARAAALALPRSLDGAGSALNLNIKKDKEGHRLMLKLSKPRRPSKNNPAEWHSDPAELLRLLEYCVTDVGAEIELFLKTPELIPFEKKVWELDQKINLRGIRIDEELVDSAIVMARDESAALQKRLQDLTHGDIKSVGQIDTILKYLETLGVKIETLTAKSVSDTLKRKDIQPLAREILEIRRDAAKTSVRKYPALKQRIGEGTRMRDYLLYHGASTGRWTGRGFQPQNLPRASMKAKIVEQAIGTIKENDLEMLRLFYGNPMEALSSALRGCLISSKEKAFYCGDYASIEVRVLFWLAGHSEGLEAYAQKRDLYREMASKIYNVKLENVTKDQREIGKRAILGSGYQMSHKKFKETCAQFGVIVSEELAQKAVSSYRELHYPVAKFWPMTERCAVEAVRNEGKAYTYGRCTWFKRGGFLWVRLPSGRTLAYKGPEVRYEPTPWGEKRPKLYHWCENPISKKWECAATYGGRLVENCLTGDTLVLTDSGWVPLEKVKITDLVFDGSNFVSHQGLIYKGEKEIMQWQGVRLTEDHLILAGTKWLPAMHLDENATRDALNLGRDLVPWLWSIPKTTLTQEQFAGAIAAEIKSSSREIWQEKKLQRANIAGTNKARGKEQEQVFSRIKGSDIYGHIDIRGSCPDVTTQNVKHIKIMVLGALECLLRGKEIDKRFMSTQKRLRVGITRTLTWIGSIILKGISRTIFGSSLGRLIQEIGARPFLSRYLVRLLACQNSGKDFALSGGAIIPSLTISQWDEPQSKSLNTTKQKEKVYDLKNCGPNHRFMILTSGGPAIAHNCTQAAARDFMAEAMLRLEENGFEVLLSVHDELLTEAPKDRELSEFESLMSYVPAWGKGCPIGVEAWRGFRYKKG